MSFFRSPKMWKSQGKRFGLYGRCWSVSHKISETYPSPDWQYGDGRYHAKWWFRPTAFLVILTLWHVAEPSAAKKQTTPLYLPPFPMLDERTLHYIHLQSNKVTTVWTCAFSLYMSPTLQMAVSIRNDSVASFCEECVLWRVFGFHLIAPMHWDLGWSIDLISKWRMDDTKVTLRCHANFNRSIHRGIEATQTSFCLF